MPKKKKAKTENDNENLFREKVKRTVIEDEMKTSYLDYSMSVIVGRALPDARDGLKPVHRKIIYGMHELGLQPGKGYRKSARVVGDVMGKYHPHGDLAIYDTLVRMAQDFSLRYPLVDGQGNFGSVDGDAAAAMRYTEARMAPITAAMLADIEKATVDFTRNFDDTLDEPTVMPALLPNLLVNGGDGIAVGMATKIPPHNLNEIAAAICELVNKPDMPDEKVAKLVQGPDFPTGGIIVGREGIDSAYKTGQGRLTVRARVDFEELKNGRTAIIVNEIPYQVNKTKLINDIVSMVKVKKTEGIADLRDESDRDGMRLVIELRRSAQPTLVLNQLYKHTQMQTTYGVIMIALVDGVPRTLTLKQALQYYIDHRFEVVERRTKYDLKAADEKAHILEGLKIALDNLDEVIEIIRKSKDVPIARERLMERFGLTEVQAQAILDMRLARLTNLERRKVLDDLKATKKLIKDLKAILADKQRIYGIINDEITMLAEEFGDIRRTEIVPGEEEEISLEDLIEEKEVAITLTHEGYIKRTPLSVYRTQGRGTKGVAGASAGKGEDFVEHLFVTNTHHYLLFFTDAGKCYWLKVYNIPEGARTARGRSVTNLLEIGRDERITAVIPIQDLGADETLVMATAGGIVKKVTLEAFSRPKRGGIIALQLDEDDRLVDVELDRPKGEIMLFTAGGQALRFKSSAVRTMGRTARGVIGIKFKSKDDKVVAMALPEKKQDVLVITEGGYGKRTPLKEYPIKGRGGMGVITLRTPKKKPDRVVGSAAISGEEDVVLITTEGVLNRVAVSSISIIGRGTRGVRVMKLPKGVTVAAIAFTRE
jgi:DNA gyrase subunit A